MLSVAGRLENIGNQFALTTILAFLISVPVMIAKEGSKWGQFVALAKTNDIVLWNMGMSSHRLICTAAENSSQQASQAFQGPKSCRPPTPVTALST